MRGDDHDGIVTHSRFREFWMHMKNPAQTGSGCIYFNDWKVEEATFAEYSCIYMYYQTFNLFLLFNYFSFSFFYMPPVRVALYVYLCLFCLLFNIISVFLFALRLQNRRFDGRKLSLLAEPVNGYLRPLNRQLMQWNLKYNTVISILM